MLRYYKLFDLLNRRGLKKKDLEALAKISNPTVTRLVQGRPVGSAVIDKICQSLNVQPGDIMEYIPDCEDLANQNKNNQ